MTMHQNEEDKPFRCSLCGKGFILKQKLKSHVLEVHMDERLFKCKIEDCDYAAKSAGNLKKHESGLHIWNRKYRWNMS